MKKSHPDYPFIFLLAILVMFGIIMVFSSSLALALKNSGDSFYYVKKHIFYVLLGVACFYFGLNLNISKLRKNSLALLMVTLFLSLLVFVPGIGRKVGGGYALDSIIRNIHSAVRIFKAFSYSFSFKLIIC
ncbi:FtsW/RodA/SpoVE family cell cycle protein [Candidatus Margulisiibacteriota bacterium]